MDKASGTFQGISKLYLCFLPWDISRQVDGISLPHLCCRPFCTCHKFTAHAIQLTSFQLCIGQNIPRGPWHKCDFRRALDGHTKIWNSKLFEMRQRTNRTGAIDSGHSNLLSRNKIKRICMASQQQVICCPQPILYRILLYGCVSQGLGTTESTNLIGWNRWWKRSRFSHLDRHLDR